ncbi:(2Fe-2S)-binding protein [Brevibacillus marinus]|uniref:(2Fe-2S)-binding protein n=1 Tax=Brevibacillus marinus TaxID=2496837 RepID=UPI000F8345F3|nr:(2Fe-2S)-binding protein [Brevibacillus marinus]
MNLQDALDYLEDGYGIFIGDSFYANTDYLVQDLIEQKEKAEQLLHIQSKQMNRCSKVVTGTIFGKRYSVLGMGFFDALIQFDILLETNPIQVGIKLGKGGEMSFALPPSAVKQVSDLSREQINNLLLAFIQLHLTPLFHAVSRLAGSKTDHMFSQVSHNLHQTALRLRSKLPDQEQKIDAYLNALVSDPLFGEAGENPLQGEFRLYQPPNGSSPFYIRKHCCLAYVIHGADKSFCCATCPLIPDEERVS